MPDTEPLVQRRPQTAVTEDLIMRMDAALEKTQGHKRHAAHILGIDIGRFQHIVQSNPRLRAKWLAREQPVPETTPAGEFHRDESILPFSEDDVALVEAYSAECDVWEKGMDRLRFTQEKRDFLEAVQVTHGQHWRRMAQMFQGGVSYTATELLFQFNKINETIEDTYADPKKYERTAENQWGTYVTKTAHEVRMELIDRALHIAEMFRKLNSDSERAVLIAAQVEKLKVEQAQDVKKRKKAAWSRPMASDAPSQ